MLDLEGLDLQVFDISVTRIQIGMFRPIPVDHTNCLQVAIKIIISSMRNQR
jgi:hypothetical protein